MKRRYEALQEFFLGYFHPDWHLDANSWIEVADDFRNTADSKLVNHVLADLREVIAEPVSDAELNTTIMHDYSLFYDPSSDGFTMRAWFEELLRDLQAGQMPPKHW